MPRKKRCLVSQGRGLYHLMSRVVGGDRLLRKQEKEYFLNLLKRFSASFFIRIHAFCIMSNHFHILATCMDQEAAQATKEELLERYKNLYPKNPGPPEGTYDDNRMLIHPDEDGGIERLRKRFGSISYFMKELKQVFTCWYNEIHNRKGYFWSARFKSVVVSLNEAQLICSAYIDLNSVRANISKKPEDYRWCSLGLRMRSKKEAASFLFPLALIPTEGEGINHTGTGYIKKTRLSLMILSKTADDNFSLYREFVYKTGAIEVEGKASISPDLVDAVMVYHGSLAISDRLRYRVKNISEGLAFGSYELIASLQSQWRRKHIRPRSFMNRDCDCCWSYSTRVLRS